MCGFPKNHPFILNSMVIPSSVTACQGKIISPYKVSYMDGYRNCTTNVLLNNMLFRYWWIRIKALAHKRDWNELEKFSKSKKSPIGYEVCNSMLLHV